MVQPICKVLRAWLLENRLENQLQSTKKKMVAQFHDRWKDRIPPEQQGPIIQICRRKFKAGGHNLFLKTGNSIRLKVLFFHGDTCDRFVSHETHNKRRGNTKSIKRWGPVNFNRGVMRDPFSASEFRAHCHPRCLSSFCPAASFDHLTSQLLATMARSVSGLGDVALLLNDQKRPLQLKTY